MALGSSAAGHSALTTLTFPLLRRRVHPFHGVAAARLPQPSTRCRSSGLPSAAASTARANADPPRATPHAQLEPLQARRGAQAGGEAAVDPGRELSVGDERRRLDRAPIVVVTLLGDNQRLQARAFGQQCAQRAQRVGAQAAAAQREAAQAHSRGGGERPQRRLAARQLRAAAHGEARQGRVAAHNVRQAGDAGRVGGRRGAAC